MVTQKEQEALKALDVKRSADLEELAEADRKGRAPRTAGQVGIGGSVFVIIDYVLRGYLGLDLDPNGSGTEMPALVTVAFTTVAAYIVALYMNRKRTPADGGADTHDEVVV